MSKKRKSYFQLSTVAVGILAALLNACAGGEGDTGQITGLPEIEGLRVSLTDFRFGMQNVGSQTPQKFTLSNVGVDTYPINCLLYTSPSPRDS